MRKMKKALAAMMAATMVLSMNMTAWAENLGADGETVIDQGKLDENGDPTYGDAEYVTITKDYIAVGEKAYSPAETFGFTIENVSVTDAAINVNVENMPTPSIGTVEYEAGEAGKEGAMTKKIGVGLPIYKSVGIYTYKIREIAGNTAGVTYYDNDIKLVVTVQETADGKIRVAAVHTEEEAKEGEEPKAKSDNFPNVYSAGSLAVSKTVTGNMGDQTKDFTVNVTFKKAENVVVGENIQFMDDGTPKLITPDNWLDEDGVTLLNEVTVPITLRHGETVTFDNIPYGITYDVNELNYSNDGYDAPVYVYDDEVYKEIDSEMDTVGITNNKGLPVDTGVMLDSAPYIILLAVAACGVFFVAKKRRDEEMF